MKTRKRNPPVRTERAPERAAVAPSLRTDFGLRAAGLLLLSVIAYAPSLGGSFIWDDPDYVVNNPTLRNLDGLRQIWFEPTSLPQYYPLVHTSFWIEYHLWGLHPAG